MNETRMEMGRDIARVVKGEDPTNGYGIFPFSGQYLWLIYKVCNY